MQNEKVLEMTIGAKRIAVASYIHNKAVYVSNYDEAMALYGEWYIHAVMRRCMLYNAVIFGFYYWKSK